MKVAVIINEWAGAVAGMGNRDIQKRIFNFFEHCELNGDIFLLSSDNADAVLERFLANRRFV
ncbi:MAG: hypothetical protein WD490_01395 [Opitutales bacterium]